MRRFAATFVNPSTEVTYSASVPSTCGSKAKASTQRRSRSPIGMASPAASFMNLPSTVPYCGPIVIPTRPWRPVRCVLPDADGLDVGAGIRLDGVEDQPFDASAVLDAGGAQVGQDSLIEQTVVLA